MFRARRCVTRDFPPEGFSIAPETIYIRVRYKIPYRSLDCLLTRRLRLLLESVEPQLGINRGRCLYIPRCVPAGEQLVQVEMRAHGANQPQRGNGGVEVANQAPRSASGEVRIDRIK